MEVKIKLEDGVKEEFAESIIKEFKREEAKKFLEALEQANVAILVCYEPFRDKTFLYLQKYDEEGKLEQGLYEGSISEELFNKLTKQIKNYA